MEYTFTETEVANLVSIVGNLVVLDDTTKLENIYKELENDETLSRNLSKHIIAVVNTCRNYKQ